VNVKVVAHTIVIDDVAGYVPHHNVVDDYESVTDLDELAELSGRNCYLSWNRPNPKTRSNKDYLNHILEVQHSSVMGHGYVTFYVSGVSRALLLELERHAEHMNINFSVVSQRYVDHGANSDFRMVNHPLLEKYKDEVVREKMSMSWTVQDILEEVQGKTLDAYDLFVEFLMSKGHTRKEARGAARNVLPEGTETRFLVTGSVRAWRDIIQKRYSVAADAEIRDFAKLVLFEMKSIAPHQFQDFDEVEG
jgi:thymidylate synthase (FAD)